MHISWLSRDRNLIRESPGGPSRLRSRKRCSVNSHLLLRQFSYGCPGEGQYLLGKCLFGAEAIGEGAVRCTSGRSSHLSSLPGRPAPVVQASSPLPDPCSL